MARDLNRRLAVRPGGFTVLELVSTLAILAVLMALAVPALSATVPAALADAAARSLAADAELARVKAIARNTAVRVVVDLARSSWRVESREEDGTFAREKEQRLPPGVAIDRSASSRVVSGAVSVSFQPRGTTADNATITLVAAGTTKKVIIAPNGRVRTE
jgi:type IV fimbrial biogenesis protein FimT